MDKELFWQIIERAEVSKGNSVDSGIRLVQHILKQHSPEEIVKFQVIYDTYKEAADRELIMGLACLLMGYSDNDECADVFDYFLDALVFYGKERYLRTLKFPDSFVETLSDSQPEEYDVEALNCLAYNPFVDQCPRKDFKESYESLLLSDREKDGMLKEIIYFSHINTGWEEVTELEDVLPEVFELCFTGE